MSRTLAGAGVGAALALSWIALGFWAFVLVAAAMLLGAAIGRVSDGSVDVRAVADALRGRRRSS